MKESCHTCEWVMSHMWKCHVTRMKESGRTFEGVTPHTWHTYDGVMSQLWSKCGTRMKEACCTYEEGGLHVWRSYVACMKDSCHTREWFMSHTWHRWRSHVARMNESRHTYGRVMLHVWKRYVAHMQGPCHKCEGVVSQTSRVTQKGLCHTHEEVGVFFFPPIWGRRVTHRKESWNA